MKNYIIPQTDIIEEQNDFQIIMDVPGTDKKNIDINLDNNKLTITAKLNSINKEWKKIFGNIQQEGYEREFIINNNIDTDNISADLKNGVLKIDLPKTKNSLPRKIKIKSNG